MTNFNELVKFGWNDFFEACFSEFSGNGLLPARVAVEHKNSYVLYSKLGDLNAEKAGKFFYSALENGDLPAVGDWVVIKPIDGEAKAIIEAILPRKSKFSRKQAGVKTVEQIVAANVDTVFIVGSLNEELNLRRLERYLTLAWDSSVLPVIVLNKSDLCENIEEQISEIEQISFNTNIHIVSALENRGIDELRQYFEDNKTVAVLGSSGVGKSTLINTLCGSDRIKVSAISDYKDKGRHTTTRRELTLVPGGGLIIDTPGMREIQLWEGSAGLDEAFEDIAQLAEKCKFKDCKHESEPGCAVKHAIKEGIVDRDRFKSYRKLHNEIKYFERKNDIKAKISEKKKWKKLTSEGAKRGLAKRGIES